MTKPMKDYVPLLKVGNGKVNDIVNEINNWQNKTETQKDHLVIRYEATDSELQVLEYMYKQTKGI